MKKLFLVFFFLIPTTISLAQEKAYLLAANDLIAVTNGSQLISNTTTFTIEFWANFSTAPAVSQGLIDIASNGFVNVGFFALSNSKMLTCFNTTNCSNNEISTTTVSISTGTCYHFAFVFDNGVHRFYFNESQLGTDVNDANYTSTTPTYTSTDYLFFGLSMDSTITNFHGLLDDIRIWSTARSAVEILSNYNNATEYTPLSDSNLIAYWKLNKTSESIDAVVAPTVPSLRMEQWWP